MTRFGVAKHRRVLEDAGLVVTHRSGRTTLHFLNGAFRGVANDTMKQHGAPDVVLDGEVVEADPPHRLVQTWRALFMGEDFTRLTYEIDNEGDGVSKLTVTHDVTGAPQTAAQTSGQIPEAGGGWSQTLSDLKTPLETGRALYS